jgi:hypothetical protein
MGYKTKSMIYAKSLEANLNITGGEKKKEENTISFSGYKTAEDAKNALKNARETAEKEAEERSNPWIMKGALGKKAAANQFALDGTGAKKLPEKDSVQDFTRMTPKPIPQFEVPGTGDDKLIKTDSKKTGKSTVAKEAGAYSKGTKLLNKTGQDAGVLSGLASGSPGTQVGTAIGIMVNKMDKSPRSTAKFDSKIKEAQGRGNLAKAARLEKREAGYAYRQEKRATRIDPTYKGKTDNTKAEKLKAGKIRRASTAAAAKPKTKPVISEARKKASNKYFAGESDRAVAAEAATKGATKAGSSNSSKMPAGGPKRIAEYKKRNWAMDATTGGSVRKSNVVKTKPAKNSTGNAASQHSLTKKPGSLLNPGASNRNVSTGAVQGLKTTNLIPSKNISASVGSNKWFKTKALGAAGKFLLGLPSRP